MRHFLFSGLGSGEFLTLCLITVSIFVGITVGLSYLAGYLAKLHGDYWEKRLKEEDKKEQYPDG